jgi:hypothetical protein
LQTSVYDLTWSYGEVFNAMQVRPKDARYYE